jgi:hypothetical protein
MKTLVLLILGTALVITFVVSGRSSRKRLARYYSRGEAESSWRRRFPHATPGEIREFLHVFAEAFLLDQKHALSFCPDDPVMEVYRTIYPSRLMADALEAETFVRECQRRYGVDVAERLGRSTLGEIFGAMQKNP